MKDISLEEFQFESQTSYTLLEEIGRGGMGIVYLAARYSGGVTDYVVLKTLKKLESSEEEALLREANLAATLRHENIVKTYGLESIPLSALSPNFRQSLDELSYSSVQKEKKKKVRRLQFRRDQPEDIQLIESGEAEEKQLLLLVVDYVDGMDLRELHQEHLNLSLLLPVPFAGFIISRIARALGYSHNYIIHRNISPENILINTHGICKLSDFGISVAVAGLPGYLKGKLPYMSPEQMQKRRVDEASDLFSLGAVAYHVITGIPLFAIDRAVSEEEQIKSIEKQLSAGIVPPDQIRKDIPEELSSIIVKMLMPTPQLRYQRAVSVANDFEKKYLYSKGYGPTNNSLATYLSIFESKFSMYNEEQLEYLSFLKNDQGELQLKRKMALSEYTQEGVSLLQLRDPALYQRLQEAVEVKESGGHEERRTSLIKVRHLDNVIESFIVKNDPVIIGCSEEATIALKDEYILEQHCQIKKVEDDVFLIPFPQADVYVGNSAVLEERELQEGDRIKMGNHLIFFINQTFLRRAETKTIFQLNAKSDLNTMSQNNNFIIDLQIVPEVLPCLAGLVEKILEKTNLSELKKGVIPTAMVETLQNLKGTKESNFRVHIRKSPTRIFFTCTECCPHGYDNLLSIFKKHRASLLSELEEKESYTDVGSDLELHDELMGESGAHEVGTVYGKSEDDFPDFDFDDDDDFSDFEDMSILAAKVIVHSFDRIEFKKNLTEVEFVVYL